MNHLSIGNRIAVSFLLLGLFCFIFASHGFSQSVLMLEEQSKKTTGEQAEKTPNELRLQLAQFVRNLDEADREAGPEFSSFTYIDDGFVIATEKSKKIYWLKPGNENESELNLLAELTLNFDALKNDGISNGKYNVDIEAMSYKKDTLYLCDELNNCVYSIDWVKIRKKLAGKSNGISIKILQPDRLPLNPEEKDIYGKVFQLNDFEIDPRKHPNRTGSGKDAIQGLEGMVVSDQWFGKPGQAIKGSLYFYLLDEWSESSPGKFCATLHIGRLNEQKIERITSYNLDIGIWDRATELFSLDGKLWALLSRFDENNTNNVGYYILRLDLSKDGMFHHSFDLAKKVWKFDETEEATKVSNNFEGAGVFGESIFLISDSGSKKQTRVKSLLKSDLKKKEHPFVFGPQQRIEEKEIVYVTFETFAGEIPPGSPSLVLRDVPFGVCVRIGKAVYKMQDKSGLASIAISFSPRNFSEKVLKVQFASCENGFESGEIREKEFELPNETEEGPSLSIDYYGVPRIKLKKNSAEESIKPAKRWPPTKCCEPDETVTPDPCNKEIVEPVCDKSKNPLGIGSGVSSVVELLLEAKKDAALAIQKDQISEVLQFSHKVGEISIEKVKEFRLTAKEIFLETSIAGRKVEVVDSFGPGTFRLAKGVGKKVNDSIQTAFLYNNESFFDLNRSNASVLEFLMKVIPKPEKEKNKEAVFILKFKGLSYSATYDGQAIAGKVNGNCSVSLKMVVKMK